MGLDIRIPIGLLFTTLGSLLVLTGILSNAAIYERSLNININLWWGIAIVVFGVAMLVAGWQGTKSFSSKMARAGLTPEKRSGKEH